MPDLWDCGADFHILDIVIVKRLKPLVKVIGKHGSIADNTAGRNQCVFERFPDVIDGGIGGCQYKFI